MECMEYKLVRSKRKTLALYVRPDGSLEVKAPIRTDKLYIEKFVLSKKDWILKTKEKLEIRKKEKEVVWFPKEEIKNIKSKAELVFNHKCREYAKIMDVEFRSIKINSAKTRWGSCNIKGDINFTYRLIFAPEPLIDYVIVHELAHLREMNHSNRFWEIVKSVMPDCMDRRKLLREYQHTVEINGG